MKVLLRLLVFMGLIGSVGSGSIAFAHTSGASFIGIQARDATTASIAFDFDLRDLDQFVGLDIDMDGALTWKEIDDATPAIAQTILAHTIVTASGACAVTRSAPLAIAAHGEGPFARVTFEFECDRVDSLLSLDHSAWFDFDPGHRALVEYTDSEGRTTLTVLSQSSPHWRVDEARFSRLKRFVLEGAVHLVTGYDHLAFLAVLLLSLARRRGDSETLLPVSKSPVSTPLVSMMRRALLVITAFTLAHSFTLVLAATNLLVLPSKPVEVAIAISVVLAAALNLRRSESHHGWKLAFAFGLVHGLGFAGALAELAGKGIDLLALAAFNIGIEAAQIAVAGLLVPVIWFVFRGARMERIGLPVASLLVAVVAGFWVVSRLTA